MPLHSSFSQIPRPTLSSELGKVVGWASRFQTQVTNTGYKSRYSSKRIQVDQPRFQTQVDKSRCSSKRVQIDQPRLQTQVTNPVWQTQVTNPGALPKEVRSGKLNRAAAYLCASYGLLLLLLMLLLLLLPSLCSDDKIWWGRGGVCGTCWTLEGAPHT